MTTKDEFLFYKNKQKHFSNKNSQPECKNQFSNLNLNNSYINPILISVQTCSKSYNDKFCADSNVFDNYKKRKKLLSLDNPSKWLKQEIKAEENPRWKKDSSSTTNNKSTLSLHITAFENSCKTASSDLFGGKNSKNLEKQIIASTFVNQNPFEFPRQQNDRISKPGVSHFKSSQRLLNPNEGSNNALLNIVPMLSSLFSRDPRANFSYELPADSFCQRSGINLGYSFKKAEPNEKATCFWTSSNMQLRTQAQKLKTLRHPNIITFYDSLEIQDTFYLVTEPCKPLSAYFEDIKLTPAQKELVVSWGLLQILKGLKFLHNEVKITQGSMREAIYVTSSGDWKLSAFHQTETFKSAKKDFNDLAVVIWQIFNGFNESISDSREIGRVPKRLHTLYKKLDSKGQIMAATDLLTECRSVGGFMKNKFVDTLLFLEEFQLRESTEKQAFFMQLKDNLDMFPDDIAKNKILPKLIHTYEYGDAGSHILIPMVKLGRLLDEEEYQHRIVPCLVKLFSSPDRTTRVKLLEKIEEFAPHLKPQVLNDKIYGNLVTGFLDTNPAVRESTVKAMVLLAEKLNYNNLNVDLMKYLARLQGGDDQPGIRTNTTICLGKIGCYIDPSQRQKILISAFSRALKDPFPPARMSGVLALGATQQFYTLNEVATKILPALSLLTIDPEKQVRDQGFKALKGFLEKLEKASENPSIIPELEAQVNAGGRSGLLSSDKVPAWVGGAIKAISGKFYKSPITAEESVTTSASEATGTTKSTEHERATKAEDTIKKTEATHKSVTDGWGDLVDDEQEEDEDEDAAWNSHSTSTKAIEKSPPKSKDQTPTGWDIDDKGSTADPDDWTTDWEKPKPKVSSTTSAPKKPILTSKAKGAGTLKLKGTAKSTMDDDLEAMLGTIQSPQESRGSTPSRPTASKVEQVSSSGWDADFDVSGDADNNAGGGWDDNGSWGATEEKPAATQRDRRAELAAKNEQRKKELAAKKAGKGLGAMKLGGAKGD